LCVRNQRLLGGSNKFSLLDWKLSFKLITFFVSFSTRPVLTHSFLIFSFFPKTNIRVLMEKFKSILILVFEVGLSLVEVTAGEYSVFYVIWFGVVSPVDFDEVKLGERIWPHCCFVVLLKTASRSDSQLLATSPNSFVTVNLLLQITGVNLTPLRTPLVELLPASRVRVACLRVYFTYFNPLLPNAMQNF
jgi:hypothetical protein